MGFESSKLVEDESSGKDDILNKLTDAMVDANQGGDCHAVISPEIFFRALDERYLTPKKGSLILNRKVEGGGFVHEAQVPPTTYITYTPEKKDIRGLRLYSPQGK